MTYTHTPKGDVERVYPPPVTVPTAQSGYSEYHWNDDGQLEWERDEEGRLTEYEYSQAGASIGFLSLVRTHPEPGVTEQTSYVRDALGRVVTMLEPWGQSTSYEWTALDQESRIVLANGAAVTYEYDLSGRLTRVLEPNVDVTGAVVSSSNPVIETIYEYDPSQGLKSNGINLKRRQPSIDFCSDRRDGGREK